MPQFTAHTTALDAAHLNALALAAGYAQTAYAPTTSTSSLGVTMPGATYVVPSGAGTALSVTVAGQSVTVPASSTTYIDITSSGNYTTTAGAVASTSTRLLKVVSSGSGVTSTVLLAPVNVPLTPYSVAADTPDYAYGTDTSGYTYTLHDSLAAIRTQSVHKRVVKASGTMAAQVLGTSFVNMPAFSSAQSFACKTTGSVVIVTAKGQIGNLDTNQHGLTLQVLVGATAYPLCIVSIPAGLTVAYVGETVIPNPGTGAVSYQLQCKGDGSYGYAQDNTNGMATLTLEEIIQG